MPTESTLQILETFASARTPLGTSELQETTGVAPATLARILKKLTQIGYVERTGHGLYTGGPALFLLGTSVINHSLSGRFLPLLQQLVQDTGLNAELYHLTSQGPQLLCWEGGKSFFQVRMAPGHHVSHPGHPAIYYYFLRYPHGSSKLWGQERGDLADNEAREFLRQAQENFVIERGHILPEIGRACAASADGQFVFGLSGLLSEFTASDEELKHALHRRILTIHGA